MGRYAKPWLPALLLAAVLILASCGGAGTGGNEQGGSDEKTAGGMAGMDHDQMGHGGMASEMLMENGRYSDELFIDAMDPHHQGAIAMARVALKNAEHEEMLQLSRNIVSTQQAEIEELKAIKKEEFGTSNVPMEMSPEQMQGMGMMMDPQQLAHEEPFDRAFIDAMIPHNVAAIEMAILARESTANPEIRELASGIVEAQEGEIQQMTGWRREWYPEGGD